MTTKRKGQPAPKWREFMREAHGRLMGRGGYGSIKIGDTPSESGIAGQLAAEIVAHGDAEKFLKAVRRGRSTHKQNLRYQLLREVEKLAGDKVKRRRPDANTPDALAIRKGAVQLELEAYAAAGRGAIGGADNTGP